MGKVRFWDLMKFFLVCYILGFFATIIHEILWIVHAGEYFTPTQRFVCVFGWCIIFMLLAIWKEIKEAKTE